jgi:serine/threonine-protein kinase
MRLQTGTLVANRYRVDKLVGEGGLAEVYKVWDTLRATPVALKLLRSEWATRSLILEKFHTEADVLSRLQHPNIVRFYELVQLQDLVFIIMDYVEGHTLRDEIRMAKGGMSVEKILAILQPVCTALHYAHSQGVIHCDVKPENILIDNLGQVKLMDFGIAQILERGVDEILGAGTVAYMAPEQILGQKILPQTDQYAIGIILFELLCGQKPFQGRYSQGSISERIRWEQVNSEPPFLKQINPTIYTGWDEIIQRSLKKDYRLRYPSILDFLFAIDEQSRHSGHPSGVVNPIIID